MKISRNFDTKEFMVSKDFPEIAAKMIYPDIAIRNMELLAILLLQPIRDWIHLPLKILSGYRSIDLNKLVGGVKTSDHLAGSAVDFTFKNAKHLHDVYTFLQESDKLSHSIGQCRFYKNRNFMHISLPSKKHHSEFAIILN
jgi:uncharacterized protein YcbK (DUF882 family)